MKTLLFPLTLLFLFSCTTKDRSMAEPESEPIATEVLIPDLAIEIPGAMMNFDSLLLVNDIHASNDFISCYSIENKAKACSFGKRGKGPNEMVSPLLSAANSAANKLALFDPNLKRIQVWSASSSSFQPSKQLSLEFVDKTISKAYFFNDSLVIGMGLLKEGLFARINPKSKSVILTGEFPIKPYEQASLNLAMAHSGQITSFPDGKHFLFSMTNVGYLACYKITDHDFIKQWEQWVTEPDFSLDGTRIMWNKNNKLGFMDMAISNDKIFGLYSGLPMHSKRGRSEENIPNTLFVFNHSGTPIKKYETNVPLLRIATDKHNKLYGLSLSTAYNLVKININ